ncbi:TlpA disulfide reductase family protein [Cognatiyoonia sp. IB215182]|uniref:TlpA disulfide reductase family protein n=1 Tax=Cognatiyoonia sp. IB215182 TaxID=3097353 RepID=UPI002A0CEA6C|nr:TlpA disulfide reductase family protein [Cognatiyoonia sp. IB215182]MDX8354259.1 TlpA disulfide reductase family protein [Cognatiyoonia sp. IB215182]
MRKLLSALLYTALLSVANPGAADIATADAMREGDMRKLIFHPEPIASSDVPFMSEDGVEMTLDAYQGKHVVLNFWATWCAPCRHEMPLLSDLQTQLGGDDLEVVTIATGRNPLPGMQRFFEEIGVDNLPLHTDARQSLARSLGVLGLPVTIVLDPEGNEIARMQGDADWASDNAIAIMQTLIGSGS